MRLGQGLGGRERRWLQWTLGLALLLGVFAGMRSAAQSTGAIGYVNPQRLLSAFAEQGNVMSTLEKERSRLETALQQELKAGGNGLTEAEKEAILKRYQDQLDQKKRELLTPTIQKVSDLIRKVADREGIRVVLDQGVVLYGGVDLTPKVLAAGGIIEAERSGGS